MCYSDHKVFHKSPVLLADFSLYIFKLFYAFGSAITNNSHGLKHAAASQTVPDDRRPHEIYPY